MLRATPPPPGPRPDDPLSVFCADHGLDAKALQTELASLLGLQAGRCAPQAWAGRCHDAAAAAV